MISSVVQLALSIALSVGRKSSIVFLFVIASVSEAIPKRLLRPFRYAQSPRNDDLLFNIKHFSHKQIQFFHLFSIV